MTVGWLIELDNGAGFVSKKHLDFGFDLDVNRITELRATLSKSAAPVASAGIKLWWDKGGAQQRLWFRGTCERITYDETNRVYHVCAYDPALLLAKSSLGEIALDATGAPTGRALRDYSGLTPYVILTQNPGPPKGLTYNSAGNQVLPLAATATNAIAAGNTGLALTFRAHTTTLLDFINNLCEQAVHNSLTAQTADAGSTASTLKDAALVQADGYWTGAIVTMTAGANVGLSRQVASFDAATDTCTFYSAFPAAIAAGDTYDIKHNGLDWWCDYSGAGAAQLNVASNRQRAGTYTAEAFQVGVDLTLAPAATDGDTTFDKVLVIGSGSGITRIESGFVGSGTKELVFNDKNIINATTAGNLATRIYNSLSNGGATRYSARTKRHNLSTQVGDNVTVTPIGGGSPVTYRCLGIHYEHQERTFILDLGRQRRYIFTEMRDVQRNLEAVANSAQFTDQLPTFLLSNGQTYQLQRTANLAVGVGAGLVTILDSNVAAQILGGSDFNNLGKGDGFLIEVVIDANVATGPANASHTHGMQNHTHDMQNHTHNYDKTDTPTGVNGSFDLGGGAAGHTHPLTYTSTATSAPSNNTTTAPSNNTTTSATPTITNAGPFWLQVYLTYDSGNSVLVHEYTLPHMTAGQLYKELAYYPFAAEDPGAPTGDFTPTRLRVDMRNDGGQAFTAGTSTFVGLWRKSLHRHNEVS